MTASEANDDDLEAGDAEAMAEKEVGFELGGFIKEGHFEKRNQDGGSAKKVGVVFKHLTVRGAGSTANYVRTLPNAILGTFGPDLYRISTRIFPSLRFGSSEPTRVLLNDFTGVVRNGEMMLVLGRPGSGCTTFLKVIANKRGGYAEVQGDVLYGGIPAAKQLAHYRGEVNYNPEDDQHMPSLTVWQTLKFSLLTKTKKREKREINVIVEALLKVFGIDHTRHTLVGNEYVRGVSGGERKRVSIAETGHEIHRSMLGQLHKRPGRKHSTRLCKFPPNYDGRQRQNHFSHSLPGRRRHLRTDGQGPCYRRRTNAVPRPG